MIVTREAIDPTAENRQLRDAAAGACCAFEGWARNHNDGKSVALLEYEAHEAIAVAEGKRVIAEARQRFPLLHARCVHRIGKLEIGECAVWVGVSSAHRDEAFAACRYIIDEVKIRLPIWKKEHYVDGRAEWVNCQRCSEKSAQRSVQLR